MAPNVYRDGRGYFLESYSKSRNLLGYLILCRITKLYSVMDVVRKLHYRWPTYLQESLIRTIGGRILLLMTGIK